MEIAAVSGINAGVQLGEGPLWDPARSVLWWVDVLVGGIHRYDPASGSGRLWHAGQTVSSLATTTSRSLLVSLHSGFGSFDPETGRTDLLVPVEQDLPSNRLNDGNVDAAGRFWAGTMEFDGARGAGTLYRLDPDLSCTAIVGHVSISNGIDWSLDGRLMYYVDTPTQRVDVFDFDLASGTVDNRRTFVTIPRADGTPDGITVDEEGHVWVALFGGWSVHRYAQDGTMSGRVDLPVSNVTSCAFGGEKLADLYITTATLGLTEDERERQHLAGALFRAHPGVSGRPPHTFGG